ncbi:MAG: helix-turn-helix domain-containing protein [Nocardioides sp.]
MDDRLLYRVPEVARYLSVSRSKVYLLIQSGALPSVRLDGSRRVRGEDVRAFVDSLLPRAS